MLLQKKQIAGLIDSLTLLQTNIDGKPNMLAVNGAISTAIAALVDGAPTALDTLKELATMLQGEETALNALIITVDGKVAKTDVTNHIDATNGGFLPNGTVASYSNILWLRSLHTNLAEIVDALTAEVAGHATRLTAVEQFAQDIDDSKISQGAIADLVGVTPDGEGRVAGYASLEALSATVGNLSKDFVAKLDITDLPGVLSGTTGQVAGYESVVALKANKLSGIKNHRIDTELDIVAYTTVNAFNFTLPTDSTQALEVKINGQTFVVGSGEAFSINGSTAGNGKYSTGNTLALDGSKLGFTLEATDKIYVTLVTTL
jgi:hypothetical protein